MTKTLVATPDPDPEDEQYRVYREKYRYLISRVRTSIDDSRKLPHVRSDNDTDV